MTGCHQMQTNWCNNLEVTVTISTTVRLGAKGDLAQSKEPEKKSELEVPLRKVLSEYKREKIMKILKDPDPDHNSRLWLVGFLRFVGYEPEEVLEIIENECQWLDYDRDYTKRQIASVFKSQVKESKGEKGGETPSSSPEPPLPPAKQYALMLLKIQKQAQRFEQEYPDVAKMWEIPLHEDDVDGFKPETLIPDTEKRELITRYLKQYKRYQTLMQKNGSN